MSCPLLPNLSYHSNSFTIKHNTTGVTTGVVLSCPVPYLLANQTHPYCYFYTLCCVMNYEWNIMIISCLVLLSFIFDYYLFMLLVVLLGEYNYSDLMT